jgi:ABC-type branched-subunit amino acid transport system substrate-binding protein
LTQALGDRGDDVIVTQVVPHYDANLPAVAEYRRAIRQYSGAAVPDFVSLEGYLVAKTFAAGVGRVRGEVTRESVVDALENAGALDIGIGIPLRFSRDQHQGSHHVWPTVVRKGALVPFEW